MIMEKRQQKEIGLEPSDMRDAAYVGSIRRLLFDLPSGNTELLVPDDGSVNYCFVEVFQNQCYRPIPGVRDVKVIVDIGANVGLAAAYFRMVYRNASIVGFEPDDRAFTVLQHNAQLLGGCEVFPYGLSDHDRQSLLYLGDSPVNSTIKRGLRPDHPTRTIELRSAFSALSAHCQGPIDILKIDTEGEELPILRSLAGVTLPRVQVIYLEFHSHADRVAIDALLAPTHLLWRAAIDGVHRGIVTYVNRESPAMSEALDAVI
jgi:FkbM family methyltransferase